MDFWKTLGVLMRRWYVAAPVLVVSIGLAIGAYFSVHTDYESTGTIVLASSADGPKAGSGDSATQVKINPLLAFDGSLNTTAQIIIQTLQDPDLKERLLAGTTQTDYQVGSGQLTGPFIIVVVTGGSPQVAQDTVKKVLDSARAELTSRQQSLKAPQSTFINAVQVVAPTQATAKTGGKTRFAVVALVLGFIASLGSAYAWESISIGRKRRAAAESAPGDGGESNPQRRPPPHPVQSSAGVVTGRLDANETQPVNGFANPTVRLYPVNRDPS
jgi:hypothetical protein